jgi:hypothetical protein
MKWSAYVLIQKDKGYTPEQIVEEAGDPLISLQYVKDVIFQDQKWHPKPRWGRRCPGVLRRQPQSSENKKLLEYYNTIGKEAFFKELRECTYKGMAQKHGIPLSKFVNFVRRYLMGEKRPYWLGNRTNYEVKLRKEGKLKRKPKPVTIQDVKNLW